MDADHQPLIAAYDGVVCDLDGVVYRGADAVPDASASLQQLVARGIRVVYATNNASRVPAEVVRQLTALGAPASEEDVVSSAQAGAARLAGELPAGAPVLALGGAGVAQALERAGLRPVSPAAGQHGSQVAVSAVLQGFGHDLTVRDFETATRLIGQDVGWVATNDDATLPVPWGQAPGNGAYVDLVATASGRRPAVVGKPHPPLYRLAMDRLGTGAARTLAIGDRLDTDIVGASATGIDSAWVLTGVDRPSDLLATDASPTYVVGSLAELLQPYAVATGDGPHWQCGEAVVTHGRDGLVIERGTGTAIEVVRAGLAALRAAQAGRADGGPGERLRRDAEALDGLVDDA